MRPNYTLARLYLDQDLSGEITLSRDHAHYLVTVLRKIEGDDVRLFNSRDGEWRASLSHISRKAVVVQVQDQLREPQTCPDIRLLFEPLRKHRTTMILEKATELGVRTLQPVVTDRTQYPKLNLDRGHAQIVEAAAQTERLDLPDLGSPKPLLDCLDTNRPLLFADEAGDTAPALPVLEGLSLPLDILVGPEGGFTPGERETLRQREGVFPVSLGPRILRADTAAISLLSLVQAKIGDW